MGAMIAQSMGQIPPQTLKMLFDQDLANWKDDADKAGKEPSLAAAAAVEQWLREL
jgi:hypothetical protein